MTSIFKYLIIFTLTTSCIKTAEQLQKEKRLEAMSDQMGDTQALLASMVEQLKEMQNQMNNFNGRLEMVEHRQNTTGSEELKNFSESLALLKTQQESSTSQLTQIQAELTEQRSFIQKVTEGLASVKDSGKPAKSQKKKSAKKDLEAGLLLVKNDQYDEARNILESLIDHSELTPGEKNKVLHGLGRVEYYSGNHDKAMIYFSKIFTRFPKASLAPSSLLFIGKSLEKMGKKDEAREAFKKVAEDYKGTEEADEARKSI